MDGVATSRRGEKPQAGALGRTVNLKQMRSRMDVRAEIPVGHLLVRARGADDSPDVSETGNGIANKSILAIG